MKKQIKILFLITYFAILTGCKNGSFTGSAALNQVGNTDPTSTQNHQTGDGTGGAAGTGGDGSTSQENNIGKETEEFSQPEQQKVDILMVVDNSHSMQKHQEKLAARFGHISTSLQEIDWQMAFINTDANDIGKFYNLRNANGEVQDENGNNIQILTSNMTNGDALFSYTINAIGSDGSDLEQPLTNIVTTVQQNPSFFRSDATLAVIILSNEDEAGGTQPTSVVQDIKTYLNNADKRLFVYGIIIKPDDSQCLNTERSIATDNDYPHPKYGQLIAQLADQTQGFTKSICQENYLSHVQDISDDLKAKASLKEIPLKHAQVIENTVEVKFFSEHGQEVERGWNYDATNNKVILDEVLASGMSIEISYSYQY